MARARNIKPGFFANEDLAECTPWARLCFAGLWTLADREGRLEDRPKRIKGELFRFDTVDVEPLLRELERHQFIARYEVDGSRFIQVSKFSEHQTPHYSEKPSVIKPPGLQEKQDDLGQQDSKSPPGVDASSRGGHNPLIPDSLIPDSPNPEFTPAIAGGAASVDAGLHLSLVKTEKPKGPPDCPHQQVLELWAEVLPHLPQHTPSQWKGSRADHLRARWRETAAEKAWAASDDGLAYLRKLFRYVSQSPFLCGRVTPRDPNRKPFVCTLAWLVKPENWAKTIEGEYHQESA